MNTHDVNKNDGECSSHPPVIPAQASIHDLKLVEEDSRLRENDGGGDNDGGGAASSKAMPPVMLAQASILLKHQANCGMAGAMLTQPVIPAQAGIHDLKLVEEDSRLRENDGGGDNDGGGENDGGGAASSKAMPPVMLAQASILLKHQANCGMAGAMLTQPVIPAQAGIHDFKLEEEDSRLRENDGGGDNDGGGENDGGGAASSKP